MREVKKMGKKNSKSEDVVFKNGCEDFDGSADHKDPDSSDRNTTIIPQKIKVGLGKNVSNDQKFVILKLGDDDDRTVTVCFSYKAFKHFVENLGSSLKRFEKFNKL